MESNSISAHCARKALRRNLSSTSKTLREITEQFKKMMGGAGACGVLGRRELQGRGMTKSVLKQSQLPGDLFIEMKHRFPKPSPRTESHDSESQGLLVKEVNDTDSMQPHDLTRKLSLRRYTLSGAADSWKEQWCAKHHHKLDLFCKSDGECICSECAHLDHLSHNIISAELEWLKSKVWNTFTTQ